VQVLLMQMSSEQEQLWQKALSSQQLEVLVESAESNILQTLRQKQRDDQPLPDLILVDIGIRHANSSTLVASTICRWCAEHHPSTKVVMTSSRQAVVKKTEKYWATRQGAVELLPMLQRDNLVAVVGKLAEIIGFRLQNAPLEQIASTLAQVSPTAETPDADNTEIIAATSRNIRESATAELVRKMAMIPLLVMSSEDSQTDQNAPARPNITLDATLATLPLHDFIIELSQPGFALSQAFQDNPILPGAVLYRDGEYAGMISRRRFLEFMSRPYGLELFSKRPLSYLYEEANTDVMVIAGGTPVVNAVQACLKRSLEVIYEPIVVKLEGGTYKLLDVHDLIMAQSQIHELATQLLREQTRDRMAQTDKMATLGQMMVEIAHDIRNPVNFIYSNVDYLNVYAEDLMNLISAYEESVHQPIPKVNEIKNKSDYEFLKSDMPKVINSIRFGSEQLLQMVNGLQTFSRVEGDKPSKVNIHTCLDNSLTIMGHRIKNTKIEKRYGAVPEIMGFSGQLMQVFMNLISNAVDAMQEAAPKLRAYYAQKQKQAQAKGVAVAEKPWQPQIVITTGLNPEGLVSIKIADNGPGIPKDIQDKIFESFFTTKDSGKGTGLGLAICHQIVTQKHRGKIKLNSPYIGRTGKPKRGTEFEVLLPVS
jgi:two-component system NtrC family sensor kinase